MRFFDVTYNCEWQTWIVGKWITPREQRWAPSGAHFHQFVVPPIFHFRRDCTYGDLAAMRLPDDVEGLGSCEVRKQILVSVSIYIIGSFSNNDISDAILMLQPIYVCSTPWTEE